MVDNARFVIADQQRRVRLYNAQSILHCAIDNGAIRHPETLAAAHAAIGHLDTELLEVPHPMDPH